MKRSTFLKSTILMSTCTLGTTLLAKGVRRKTTALPNPTDLEPKIIRNDEGTKVNVIGDEMTFKLTGKDTNNQFTLIEEHNEPGVMIPLHVHTNEDEIFKVLEGELELTVGGNTTVLKAGDLAFGPRNVPHSWKVIGTTKARVILSVFPSGIEHMFEELGQLPPGPPDLEKVAAICGKFGISFV
ncbi:cupin domain-containing protein [Arenibacter sp. 6A1]|nr:cupin domain-containing protein [Arenibacter sp. 6A1]